VGKTQNLYYCVKEWRYEACKVDLIPEGTAWVWKKVENVAVVKKYRSKQVAGKWVPTNPKNAKEWDTPPKDQARKGIGNRGSGRSIGEAGLKEDFPAGTCVKYGGQCVGTAYNASNKSTNFKR
jgi:hypothetical protein